MLIYSESQKIYLIINVKLLLEITQRPHKNQTLVANQTINTRNYLIKNMISNILKLNHYTKLTKYILVI